MPTGGKCAEPCWTERGGVFLSWNSISEASEFLDISLCAIRLGKSRARKEGSTTFLSKGATFYSVKPDGVPIIDGTSFLLESIKKEDKVPKRSTVVTPSGKRTLLYSGYCSHGVGKLHY